MRYSGGMPVPLSLLRGLLGALCIFFSYLLGRSAVRAYRGQEPKSRAYGLAIRVLVTGAAMLWRQPLATVAIVYYALAAVALGSSAWMEWRPRKPEEDLTKTIFPDS